MTEHRHSSFDIRRLAPPEWARAYPVVAQLRALDEAEFLERVRRQSYSGYELVAAFRDGKIIGVMGMRPVHTLARGAHLHIDDLVVDATGRGSGVGRSLMEYAEIDARARGMTAIFLDARPEAIPFYEREQYVPHLSPSMKKMLAR
ncbi:GCN5 family acetyltransferase [Burkholderia pseudomultivorans]|uniref:GNAT family N-acetyltransferase n=1 Tax=Burkholderia pseudomultivorans TaxID=1207504 RepID=UPI0007536287|nr:GNAT family N-acetyltransferase [Burkholderia pseudomultivorans]KVC57380.1 GCN5 family acetyltransferase [Burkholderia pseudomultivorans]MDS0857129.1 GNAT family N-acetyltransferase [Burkholderia pseudomultivorans]